MKTETSNKINEIKKPEEQDIKNNPDNLLSENEKIVEKNNKLEGKDEPLLLFTFNDISENETIKNEKIKNEKIKNEKQEAPKPEASKIDPESEINYQAKIDSFLNTKDLGKTIVKNESKFISMFIKRVETAELKDSVQMENLSIMDIIIDRINIKKCGEEYKYVNGLYEIIIKSFKIADSLYRKEFNEFNEFNRFKEKVYQLFIKHDIPFFVVNVLKIWKEKINHVDVMCILHLLNSFQYMEKTKYLTKCVCMIYDDLETRDCLWLLNHRGMTVFCRIFESLLNIINEKTQEHVLLWVRDDLQRKYISKNHLIHYILGYKGIINGKYKEQYKDSSSLIPGFENLVTRLISDLKSEELFFTDELGKCVLNYIRFYFPLFSTGEFLEILIKAFQNKPNKQRKEILFECFGLEVKGNLFVNFLNENIKYFIDEKNSNKEPNIELKKKETSNKEPNTESEKTENSNKEQNIELETKETKSTSESVTSEIVKKCSKISTREKIINNVVENITNFLLEFKISNSNVFITKVFEIKFSDLTDADLTEIFEVYEQMTSSVKNILGTYRFWENITWLFWEDLTFKRKESSHIKLIFKNFVHVTWFEDDNSENSPKILGFINRFIFVEKNNNEAPVFTVFLLTLFITFHSIEKSVLDICIKKYEHFQKLCIKKDPENVYWIKPFLKFIKQLSVLNNAHFNSIKISYSYSTVLLQNENTYNLFLNIFNDFCKTQKQFISVVRDFYTKPISSSDKEYAKKINLFINNMVSKTLLTTVENFELYQNCIFNMSDNFVKLQKLRSLKNLKDQIQFFTLK